MASQYNLMNFVTIFREYLIAGNVSPVTLKNYLSDIRHFFGWLGSDRIITSSTSALPNTGSIGLITTPVISSYKTYLIDNNIPHKTINRRLSTIRKFCTFCISQGWMKENPAKKVINISPLSSRLPRLVGPHNDVLRQFQADLKTQGYNSHDITNYLNDVEEFCELLSI